MEMIVCESMPNRIPADLHKVNKSFTAIHLSSALSDRIRTGKGLRINRTGFWNGQPRVLISHKVGHSRNGPSPVERKRNVDDAYKLLCDVLGLKSCEIIFFTCPDKGGVCELLPFLVHKRLSDSWSGIDMFHNEIETWKSTWK